MRRRCPPFRGRCGCSSGSPVRGGPPTMSGSRCCRDFRTAPTVGAGRPAARRRRRPSPLRGAGGPGSLGQAPRLPLLHDRAGGPGRGAVAPPLGAPDRGRHVRLHVAGLLELLRRQIEAQPRPTRPGRPSPRCSSSMAGCSPTRIPIVAQHAAAAQPVGCARDAAGAANPGSARCGDDAGPHVRTRLPSLAAGARRLERRSPAGTGRRSCTTRRGSSASTAATCAAGTSARSPARWAARSRSPSPAASRTPTNTGRSRPPADACPRPRS